MNILIVTDAWEPQVNGVVRTLKQTRQELEHLGHIVDVLPPSNSKPSLAPPTQKFSYRCFLAERLLSASKHSNRTLSISLPKAP
ncbi:Uncharacterised protein [Iodobacter fluviatilis]|uniref:Glycosyltransferase subfamily 4-like N-terminal domain-containing protein n=1 Tax=Iodobacter fluviatilis TaxID=537 RepID=A0A377SY11_9NEIS|nr:hypothetical protein [Iodobacter fluviatilis]STR45206.1 Uncharacterised protein [Iodobacter fluviatilis]